MTSSGTAPRAEANWLLASLPSSAYAHFTEWCETVPTPVAMLISDANRRIEYAYFPLAGVQSVVTVVDGVQQAGVGTVGWEGMTGLSLLHGIDRVPTRCVVKVGGFAKRILSADFARQLANNVPLRDLMHRYAQFWSEQSAQSISCNGLHSVEQRYARRLLHTHDRVESDVIPVTQALLALMLAVRRASVSTVAQSFQGRGLLIYRRGEIIIVNRRGLEAASCSCYHAIESSYQRLLPHKHRAREGRGHGTRHVRRPGGN